VEHITEAFSSNRKECARSSSKLSTLRSLETKPYRATGAFRRPFDIRRVVCPLPLKDTTVHHAQGLLIQVRAPDSSSESQQGSLVQNPTKPFVTTPPPENALPAAQDCKLGGRCPSQRALTLVAARECTHILVPDLGVSGVREAQLRDGLLHPLLLLCSAHAVGQP
jgi:hypothetical protein